MRLEIMQIVQKLCSMVDSLVKYVELRLVYNEFMLSQDHYIRRLKKLLATEKPYK